MDAVVIGDCVMDLISYADRFPMPGETLIGTGFAKGFGGNGTNQCVMISKLGGKTAMIGKVGDDTFGKEYLECFKINNIYAEHVTVTSESQTSTANICVTKSGENSIVYVPGVVGCLKREDICNAENLISTSKVLLCCYECPVEVLLEALKIGRKHSVFSIVNAAPSPIVPYEEVYQLCDVICFNETETEAATGHSVSTIEEASKAAAILISKGCNTVIITLGSKGAVACSKERPDTLHVPAKEVVPVDTTGAGDCFLGSLAYYFAVHPSLSLEEKIKRSCEIASVSTLSSGTQTSYPSWSQLPGRLFES